MSAINDHRDSPARQELVPIFVSLELSRVRRLVTWTFHGGSKMSRRLWRPAMGRGCSRC